MQQPGKIRCNVWYAGSVSLFPDISSDMLVPPQLRRYMVIGLLFALDGFSFTMSYAFLSYPVGVHSDRTGRKPVMVGGVPAFAANLLIWAE